MTNTDTAIHPLSLCTTPIEAFFGKTNLGISSGFFYEREAEQYLVTNWHVVTGRHPVTGDPLSKHAAIPGEIRIMHHRAGEHGSRQWASIRLEHEGTPTWLEHSTFGSRVDVAVIPLDVPEKFQSFPINAVEEHAPPEIGPFVGRDVFVLGYPFGTLATQLSPFFPVWKRASIATELAYDVEDLPQFLVDTATRQGMSGSPVVSVQGEFIQLMGVYSGRYGEDDLEGVQLGRVWRTSVVEEIVGAGMTGSVTIGDQNGR